MMILLVGWDECSIIGIDIGVGGRMGGVECEGEDDTETGGEGGAGGEECAVEEATGEREGGGEEPAGEGEGAVGGATGIVESIVGGVTDGGGGEVEGVSMRSEWGVPVPMDLEGPRLV